MSKPNIVTAICMSLQPCFIMSYLFVIPEEIKTTIQRSEICTITIGFYCIIRPINILLHTTFWYFNIFTNTVSILFLIFSAVIPQFAGIISKFQTYCPRKFACSLFLYCLNPVSIPTIYSFKP